MSNSRSARNPTPEEISAVRRGSGLSAKQAGELIYCTERAWHLWEAGERRMHPAIWDAFRTKLKNRSLAQIPLEVFRLDEKHEIAYDGSVVVRVDKYGNIKLFGFKNIDADILRAVVDKIDEIQQQYHSDDK